MGLMLLDQSNPKFVGADLENVIIPAAGAGITAYANDSVVQPVLQRVLPQVFSNPGVVGKLADAATTYACAEGLEYGASMANPRIGKLLGMGGKIVAGAKVLLTFLPSIYVFKAGLNLPARTTNQPSALPAAAGATAAAAPAMAAAAPVSPYAVVTL